VGSIPTGPTVVDPELVRGVARLGRGDVEAVRRAGVGALVVSGVWLVVALALLGLAAADGGQDEEHHHGNGVLLLVVLVGVPVLTWIGVHLVIALCLWRGQRWARAGAITAFGVSGLLPLWLFPLHRAGTPGEVAFVNAVLCAVVVMLALRAERRPREPLPHRRSA
jgi:hypothetical protein